MVTIKKLDFKNVHAVKCTIFIPFHPVYFILSKHTILLPDIFQMKYLDKIKEVSCICIEAAYEKNLLEQKVVNMNQRAQDLGVQVGMCGKEALIYCEGKEQEKI